MILNVQKSLLATILTVLLISTSSIGQTPKLVADIYPGLESGLSEWNKGAYTSDSYIFLATTDEVGKEVFAIRGDSVQLLKDINPGIISSRANYFTSFKGKVYFYAETGNGESALFVTDGTQNGTEVAFGSDEASSVAGFSVSSDSILYFKMNSQVFSSSDGETMDTVLNRTQGKFLIDAPQYEDGLLNIYLLRSENKIIITKYKAGEQFMVVGEKSFNDLFTTYITALEAYSGGVIFNLDDNLNSNVNGTWRCDKEGVFTKLSSSELNKTARISQNAFVGTIGSQVMLFSEEHPEGTSLSSWISFTQTEIWQVADFEDYFFLRVDSNAKRLTSYSQDGYDEVQSTLFNKQMVKQQITKGLDNMAVVMSGACLECNTNFTILNGNDGSIEDFYTYPTENTGWDFMSPLCILDSVIYYASHEDSEVGMELYSLDLNEITSATEIENDDFVKFEKISEKTFIIKSDDDLNLDLDVFNTVGQSVYRTNARSNNPFTVELPANVYVVRISDGTRVSSYKLKL